MVRWRGARDWVIEAVDQALALKSVVGALASVAICSLLLVVDCFVVSFLKSFAG
jgi:hypothetical protein